MTHSSLPPSTLRTRELFDLTHTAARSQLEQTEYPWEILPRIAATIAELGAALDPERYLHPAPTVWIAKSSTVAPTAYMGENVIIGEDTEVRHGAFIRGNALIGSGCVVGNSTELKNVILFDGVQVPHYNYVGDSVLGHCAHMGAGSITSNVKGDRSEVFIKAAPESGETFSPIPTGRYKCGGFLGDYAEVGCGCVLNPGVVLGAHCRIYPLVSVRGVIPPNSIHKGVGGIVPARAHNDR